MTIQNARCLRSSSNIPREKDKIMNYKPINLQDKLDGFSDHWSPKIIAQMNDYHFKLVKFQGDFIWHSHKDTDEVFIVLEGKMSIDFKTGKVDLRSGEMFVVPVGVEQVLAHQRELREGIVERGRALFVLHRVFRRDARLGDDVTMGEKGNGGAGQRKHDEDLCVAPAVARQPVGGGWYLCIGVRHPGCVRSQRR